MDMLPLNFAVCAPTKSRQCGLKDNLWTNRKSAKDVLLNQSQAQRLKRRYCVRANIIYAFDADVGVAWRSGEESWSVNLRNYCADAIS